MNKFLKAKARGFTISIARTDPKSREKNPNVDFGLDYNKLLALTKDNYPQLIELLPPEAKIYSDSGFEYTISFYNEIDTYCEQICQLLSELEDES
jgi:hypothetical protein